MWRPKSKSSQIVEPRSQLRGQLPQNSISDQDLNFTVKVSWVARMGWNFDDYPGFQPQKTTA